MQKLTKEQLKQIEDYIKTLPEEEREPRLKEIMSQLENTKMQCPFCLMVEGKIETVKVYEDKNFLAVLEINPANKGHTILIPKRHINHITQFSNEEAEDVGKILKKLTYSLSKTSESLNVLISEGPDSGTKFEHLVVNIIPRYKEDSVKMVWQPSQADQKELEKIKEQIIKNFPQIEKLKAEPVDEDRIKKEYHKISKRLP